MAKKKPTPHLDPHNPNRAPGTRTASDPTADALPPRKQREGQSQGAESHGDAFQRCYVIADHRLEHPRFDVRQVAEGDEVHYEVQGDLSGPVPPIRDSRYLTCEQALEIYRYMLLNRAMEATLENLYKQGKVVGGVYFGLGQEGCSCASAYALKKDEWLGPMIRNQGSMLVRGFPARDIMMQYMAKAGSPTFGKDASSHFGDIREKNVV
ncbi:MAG: thiamine pyrophosphate-dependent enzyme, partial [Terriglobales bacterium]